MSLRQALCLTFICTGFAAHAQAPERLPFQRQEVFLVAGERRELRLSALQPGRRYAIRLEIGSQTAPRGEGWVEAEAGVGLARQRWLISPGMPVMSLYLEGPEPRLHLTGGGELGAAYRVRVAWRPEPTARMPGALFIPSPNQGPRPPGAPITAVVVHATVSPTLESTVNWFLMPRSQVSSHYVVGKDGVIVQMVEDTGRAWHAGVSELEGAPDVNSVSIGIEIVNLNDGRDPFTDAQYEAVAAIIRHLRVQYAIPDTRIVSHEAVARPRGRKSDPRGFDFSRLYSLLSMIP